MCRGQTAGCDVYRWEPVHFCFVPLGFLCMCAIVCVYKCVSETFVSKARRLQCVCVCVCESFVSRNLSLSRHLSVLPAGYKFTFH